MANEATIIERFGANSAGEVMSFTVSSSVAIAKGAVMVLSASPRTMSAHSAAGQVFLGVTNAAKDASDSSTELGVVTNAVVNFAASGTINDGDTCILSNAAVPNYVEASNGCYDQRLIVGKAFGDASSSRVDVRVLK